MSDRPSRRWRAVAGLVAGFAAAILPSARPATARAPEASTPAVQATDRELLAASDLFATAPAEFRLEVEVRQGTERAGMPLEIWRRGEELALVRLLAVRDRGKFLLRRDRELYFIAPGSARPVKLAPSYRLQGAALDELLGLHLARDYRIASLVESSGVVTFDLVAIERGAAAPRLRWVVSRARRIPLRADLQSSDGKTLRVIEFAEWSDAQRGVPRRLVVKEVVRGGTPLVLLFGAFETRPVALELFDLEDGRARAGLPPPAAGGEKSTAP